MLIVSLYENLSILNFKKKKSIENKDYRWRLWFLDIKLDCKV